MTTGPFLPLSDRFRLGACLVATSVALGAALRVVLHLQFAEKPAGALGFIGGLAAGALTDTLVAIVVSTPVFLALTAFRLKILASPWVRGALFTALYTGQVFLSAVEYCFFEEFDARFNRIALDYVLFPHEVFVNIWESYNVPLVAAACLAAGLLAALPSVAATRGAAFGPLPWSARWRGAAIALGAIVLSVSALVSQPQRVGRDRVAAEIAQNDLVQLVRAHATAHVDYALYSRTLPAAEAHATAATYLGLPPPAAPGTVSDTGFQPVRRAVNAPRPTPPDVVVVLEESLGSEFVGVLGGRGLTPGFDRWAERGMLLTRLVPTGNRTVRGLEGTLCSFVPLPGDAVVKRDRSDHVATLAGVFAANGYETAFFYGGIGFFDDMKPFLTKNGYQEFVEQGDFPEDAFKTAWGVADEYIFAAALDRQVRARESGKRLFTTVLTVSNHKPFDVPPGRVPCSDEGRSRACAVSYADWALADYLDRAEAKGLLDRTIVLVLGDHGARVYGSAQIPTASYRIPGLFLLPGGEAAGRRIDRLCSQVDLGPTLLSLAGISYAAPFFGEDLTRLPPDGPGRAFVHHNRDIGILTDTRLVVLGLKGSVEHYIRVDRDADDFELVEPGDVDAEARQLERAATAVFQTAAELYEGRRLFLPPQPKRPGVKPDAMGL